MSYGCSINGRVTLTANFYWHLGDLAEIDESSLTSGIGPWSDGGNVSGITMIR
jgi:hypothetical protein